MRLIKMFSLAALAAVAAMAFVGATSASAKNTVLCKTHSEPCSSVVDPIDMLAKNPLLQITVLGITIGVTCETSLGTADLGVLDDPQEAVIEKLTWNGCKRESNGANCTVTTNEKSGSLGKIDVLLGAVLNLGTAEALNVSATVACTGLPTCTYGGSPDLSLEGAEHTKGAGNGMLSAEKATLSVEGGGLCPATGLWTALYEPSEKVYGVS